MFNTTTQPTIQPVQYSLLDLFSVISTGIFCSFCMIEILLHKLRGNDDEEEENKEAEEEEPTDNYCDNYVEEFDALSVRLLTAEELTNLNTKFVREQVAEKVEVILTFDKSTETFWYYTDQLKDVSYDILETVARKFAIDNNCKSICLGSASLGSASLALEPASHALESASLEPASLTLEPASLEPASLALDPASSVVAPPSVFAKFKKYNTAGKGSAPNFTSVVKVVEQMNHFRYRGKIYDYENKHKSVEKVPEENATLDYASYKKLLEEKQK